MAAMSKGVRIYKHDARIHHRAGVERPVRHALPSAWISWIGVLNQYRNQGARIVAVGCEEGAMAVHLRGRA